MTERKVPTIDYSDYNYDGLMRVKSSINATKYPENYQLLLEEIEKRKPELDKQIEAQNARREGSRAEELVQSKKRIEILGAIQIFAAIILGFAAVNLLTSNGPKSYIVLLLVIVFIALNAFCGYTLLTKKREWYWLSMVNQGLQVPNLMLGKLILTYSSLGGFYLGVSTTGMFSFTVAFSPGFQFHYLHEKLPVSYIGIDIIAIIFLIALFVVIGDESSKE